jgi:hypothetical protein
LTTNLFYVIIYTKAKVLLIFEKHLFVYKGGITMAAFDRICSGIPEMDTALDNIRLGDNVVWRVSELSEFKLFMES